LVGGSVSGGSVVKVGGGAFVGGAVVAVGRGCGALVGGGDVGTITGVGLGGKADRGTQISWPTLNMSLDKQLTRIRSSTGVLARAAKPANESPCRIPYNTHPGGGETTQVSGVGVSVGVAVDVTVAVEVLVTVGVSSRPAGKTTIGIRSLATSTSLPLTDSRRTCQFKLSPVAGSSFPVTGKR
jgi:hypothetical protein